MDKAEASSRALKGEGTYLDTDDRPSDAVPHGNEYGLGSRLRALHYTTSRLSELTRTSEISF